MATYTVRASTLRHADDIVLLCRIGHEVAHVIRRIHVVLTTLTNDIFSCICEEIDPPDL